MRRYAVAALILVTAACSDAAVGPSAEITSGRAMQSVILGSAPNFTMLPPVGLAVNPAVQFDPNAPHIVEVCRTTTTGDCVVRLLTYEVGAASKKDRITVNLDDAFFQVNFKLSDLGVRIEANDRFAVRVRTGLAPSAQTLGGFMIAFNANLVGRMIVEDVSGPENVSTTQNITFKYRVGEGAECSLLTDPSVNCIQVRVTNAGGTFINRDTSAGALFPANALPAGVSEVTLVVDRYVPNPLVPSPLPPNTFCLPDTNPQYNGCYIFTTEPKLDSFNETIQIAICPDYEAYSTLGPQINQVDLWKWDGVDDDTYQPLSPVESSFMDCEEPLVAVGSASSRSSSAFALARTALRPLAKLVMPSPLHAAVMRGRISPYGGGLSDFSTIGPVRRLRMETFTGEGINALPGTTITSSVRVLADGQQVAELNQGVPGVTVQFVITGGTGAIVGVADAVTNADGVASVQWTLGAGVNTLRADGLNPRPSSPFNIAGVWGSQTFGAVGVKVASGFAYGASFAAPVVKNAPGATVNDDIAFMLTMEACAEDAAPRQCFSVPFSGAAVPSYNFAFVSTTAMPAGAYTFTARMLGVPFGLLTARASAVDDTAPQGAADHAFTLGGTVPIQFTVTKRPL